MSTPFTVLGEVHPARRPRVALIGVTGYGAIYVQLVREALASASIDLVAAVIVNRDEAAAVAAEFETAGARIYPAADSFFAAERDRVDLCMIPVGIAWHARLTISALRAGMNVLVEKPLAGSLADAYAIQTAEAATGRWVAVGFQDIYAPETRWLKSRLLEGAIGRLEEIRLLGLWPRPRAYFIRNGWAGRASADGASVLDSPVNNAFAHFFNLALFLAGPASDLSARAAIESAELHRAHAIEMFDTAVIRGSADGVRLWMAVSHSAGVTREPEIILRGSSGSVVWRHENAIEIRPACGPSETRPFPDSVSTRRHMFDAALARLSAPATFVCSTRIAAEHTRLVADIQRTAAIREFSPESVSWHDGTPTAHGLAERLIDAFSQGITSAAHRPVAA